MRPIAIASVLLCVLAAPAWAGPEEDAAAGVAAGMMGDFDEATRLLSRAIDSPGLDAESLASLHNNRGVAYRLKGHHDLAIANYAAAIRLKPEFAVAYSNLGLANAKRGHYDPAIADFTEAIKLAPDDADTHFKRGNAYYDKGDYGNAIADYTRTIRLNSNFAAAYANRCHAYEMEGIRDRALKDCEKAHRLEPGSAHEFSLAGCFKKSCIVPDSWSPPIIQRVQPRKKADPATEAFNTGYRLSNQGRYAEAEAYYRRAIALNARYASAHWNLAIVLGSQGRYNESVAAMRAALRLDPRNKKYKRELAEWEEYFQKRQEQARRNARINAFNAATNRGIDLYEKNDYRGAEAAIREAIRIFPDDAGAHRNLGLILEKRERLADAIRSYREALRLDPNHSKARINLRGAEASLRKEKEWRARMEEERRKQEQEAQMEAKMSRMLGNLKEVKSVPSGDQLKGVVQTGKWAVSAKTDDEASAQARRGFDTLGVKAGSLDIPKDLGRNPWKAPVVTDEDRRRVPAIAEHEGKRDEARKRRAEYQAKLEELMSLPESEKPRDWSVRVAEAKQNESNAGNEEIYYNFRIGKALRKSNIPK